MAITVLRGDSFACRRTCLFSGRYVAWTRSTADRAPTSWLSIVYYATYLPENKQVRLQANESPRKTVMAIGVDPPTRTFVFDALLHEGIFPGQQPDLNIYRTAGALNPGPDGRREMDRLDVLESIQNLGRGIAKFRSTDTPAYQDMILHVCEQRGWDADTLRGYRCRIEYPMYSSEVVFGFELR